MQFVFTVLTLSFTLRMSANYLENFHIGTNDYPSTLSVIFDKLFLKILYPRTYSMIDAVTPMEALEEVRCAAAFYILYLQY